MHLQKEKSVLSLTGRLLQRHGLPSGCEQEALGCTLYCKVFLISSMLGHLGRPISTSDLIKTFVFYALFLPAHHK